MNLYFRVDASLQIGTGHVFRCLSIAESLSKQGHGVYFICREFSGNLISFIQSKGYPCWVLPEDLSAWPNQPNQDETRGFKLKHANWLQATQPQDAQATLDCFKEHQVHTSDWLIVDHFALDATWEKRVLTVLGCKLAVLDGQADRPHFSDVVIDPTMCCDPKKWQGLTRPGCKLYQGFPYIPLSQAFFEKQKYAKIRNNVRNVLVAFGGVDQANYTKKTVESLVLLPARSFKITVVVGKIYPHLSELKRVCELHHLDLKVNISNMADLMLQTDLAIGAGGTMAWERCMLYLPSVVIAIADNQIKQVDCLQKLGLAVALRANEKEYGLALQYQMAILLGSPQKLIEMSLKAKLTVQNVHNQAWLNVLSAE